MAVARGNEIYEALDILPDDVGVVYVISEGTDYVKIGVSTVRGLAGRLGSLQSGNPRKLTVRYNFKCSPKKAFMIEKRTHRLLSNLSVSGEWFEVSIEDATAAIAKATKYEEEHESRLIKLAELNDAINEKREREAKAPQDDMDEPGQSIFDMMLDEGNFTPETRRKRSAFDI